jgi:hypothetical protein
LPSIICAVAPSCAIADQITIAAVCIGTETSSTVAPIRLKTSAPLRTIASTSVSAFGASKPCFSTPIRMPLIFWPSAWVYEAAARAWPCRGSRPSGPAITSSNKALSATVAVIGPVWSSVSSIGITPVYGTRPHVGLRP